MTEEDIPPRDATRETGAAWLRALVVFAGIVLGFFYLPQWILTDLPGPSRDVRIWITTGWMFGLMAGLSWWAWRATGPSDRSRDSE